MSDRFLTVDAQQAATLITTATAILPTLSESDQRFVGSMLAQHEKKSTVGNPMKRLSGGQWWWVNHKIEQNAERNSVVPPEREKVEIGDMKGIIRLFDKAKQHLKKAAVVVAVKVDEEIQTIRLKPASPNGRVPDSIDVLNGNREWMGRILRSGQFEISPRASVEARTYIGDLRDFAADPETGAKRSARLTGRCVFCNTALKDERSTRVGYGKTCASHYGLSWK
jgi:hypothetical protein